MSKQTAKQTKPPQKQARPGKETDMHPVPITAPAGTPSSFKLKDKKVLITGGDSGIGKAVALLFAKEGADIAISYLNEHTDANDTKQQVENLYGRQCILLPGDVSKQNICKKIVNKTLRQFERIDILINNAAIHYEAKSLEEITIRNMKRTFEVNIYSMFYITQFALPYMWRGSCIINTSSVTAYRGSPHLIDYSATKGAIVTFTRSLADNLVERGIRVNGVAPGPIWTPLIASSFKKSKVSKHGAKAPMERPGEPAEVAPAYLFLASSDASYINGQFIHPNGGEIVNG